jgi:hypothetical protein
MEIIVDLLRYRQKLKGIVSFLKGQYAGQYDNYALDKYG